MDLHIHDADFVQYLFGMPKAVYSRGAIGPSGDYDHIAAQYVYDDNLAVVAEGGWMMTPSFGFKMTFHIALDEATIVLDSTQDPAFKVCPAKGETFTPEVEAGDGYSLEIAHFLKAIAGEKVPEIITLEQSRDTIKLILAEKESAKTGKVVKI